MAGMSGMAWMQAITSVGDAYNLHQQGKIQKTRLERQEVYQQFNDWAAGRTAGIVVAASQRHAIEERRQADLAASRALAVAAASGGGVSDPTIVQTLSNIRGEGALRASIALYEGEERARQIRIQGAGAQDFNVDPMAGYNAAAAGKIGKGALSLYARYGKGGPTLENTGGGLEWQQTGDFGGPMDAGDSMVT